MTSRTRLMTTLAVLMLASMVNGCLSKSEPVLPTGSVEENGPSEGGSTSPPAGDVPEIAVLPMPDRLNVTDCRGITARVDLPGAVVRSHVPQNYSIGDETGSLANVYLVTNLCNKVSVDGVDVGPADLHAVTIGIVSPPGMDFAAEVRSYYVLEMRTSNVAVRSWIESAGCSAEGVSVSLDIVPSFPFLTQTTASIGDAEGLLYNLIGFPYSSLVSASAIELYFCGPVPETDYLIHEVNERYSSGGGPGNVTMAAHSTLSTVLAGASASPVLMWNQYYISRVISAPDQG